MFRVKYEIEGLPVHTEDSIEAFYDLNPDSDDLAPPVTDASLRYCSGEDPKVWVVEFELPEYGLVSVTLPAGVTEQMMDMEDEQGFEELEKLDEVFLEPCACVDCLIKDYFENDYLEIAPGPEPELTYDEVGVYREHSKTCKACAES